MTPYSIPSETSGQNLFTLTTDDRQLEVESLDWESRMARLVGFQEESPATVVPVSEDGTIQEPSVSEPEEVQTKQPLSSNPFAKLGLVGGATLAMVLFAGVFLSQLMSSGNQKSTNIVTPEVRSEPTTSASPDLEAEVETLKTKLALTEQVELVKSAQQKLRTEKATPVVATRVEPVRNRPRIAQQATSAPVQTAYVPRPVPVVPPIQVPQAPQLPVVKPETPPIVNVTPPPPPNPIDEWSRLAKLGSYGMVNVATQPNTANAATYAPPQNTQVAQQPPQPPPTTPAVSPTQSQNSKSVAVGANAKAVLATAVFGETTRSRSNDDKNENKNVFVVRLKQPLKSVDGQIALPANTEFLTEIRSISEQGLLQLDVTKVIKQNNGSSTEISLPSNAITIRAPQGRPLIANQFSGKGASTTGLDVGLFVLGAAGKVGEVLNRPDTEIKCDNDIVDPTPNDTSNNDTYRNRYCFQNTNNRRNILAGLLEGGMNTVVPQIAQRNQQAISQMMQRSNVWFLAAGKDVEIYVNQSMQF
jgi:hypothetical protein